MRRQTQEDEFLTQASVIWEVSYDATIIPVGQV